jgi:ribosomal protein S18 acetylase RimI-like enzyme
MCETPVRPTERDARRRRYNVLMPRAHTLTIEPLGRDAIGLTQCMAIDADAFPFASVHFGQRTSSLRVLVARDEREARVVGFLAGRIRRGLFGIHGLAVDRAARRRGVGRALVREAVVLARGEHLRAVVLQVGVANGPAIALYRAEGFRALQRVRDYYPVAVHGERDAYQMALML